MISVVPDGTWIALDVNPALKCWAIVFRPLGWHGEPDRVQQTEMRPCAGHGVAPFQVGGESVFGGRKAGQEIQPGCKFLCENGARYRVRTCDPYRVKVMLYH